MNSQIEQLMRAFETGLAKTFPNSSPDIKKIENPGEAEVSIRVAFTINMKYFGGANDRVKFTCAYENLLNCAHAMKRVPRTLFANKLIQDLLDWESVGSAKEMS